MSTILPPAAPITKFAEHVRAESVTGRAASSNRSASRTSRQRTWNGFSYGLRPSWLEARPFSTRPIPHSLTPIFPPAIPASVRQTKLGAPFRRARNTKVRPCTPSSQSQFCPSQVWRSAVASGRRPRSEEHTSELQSRENLVCRLLLEKKKQTQIVDVCHPIQWPPLI